MKCRLICEAQCINPEYDRNAHTLARYEGWEYDVPRLITKPAGTEINNPEAYKLVRMGMAEAADEECRIRAGLTEQQVILAAAGQEKDGDTAP